jgi:hypothetical protein
MIGCWFLGQTGLLQAKKTKNRKGRSHGERTKKLNKPEAKVETDFTKQNF